MHKADQPENNNLASRVTVKDRISFPVAILVVILEITGSGNRNKNCKRGVNTVFKPTLDTSNRVYSGYFCQEFG